MMSHGLSAGTLLVTLRGEVAVETVAPGDLALTLSGQGAALKPVVRVEAVALPATVRIAAGALEPGVPIRDLVLAPGHGVALEDEIGRRVLVAAGALVNGATITRGPPVAGLRVVLERHELLMADGLPAESWPPAGAVPVAGRLDGAAAYGLHAALLAVAQEAGHRLTEAAELEVMCGAAAAERIDDCLFILPPGTGTVILRSRRFTPADTDPAGGDTRELGVCVTGILLDGIAINLGGPVCGSGFLPLEGTGWRWTDGAATLLLPPRAAEATLEVTLHPGLHCRYWLAPTPR